MKNKMNKKGFVFTITAIVAMFLAVVFLTFFAGGGIKTVGGISKFMTSIPTFIWVVLGIVIVFRVIGGRRK